MKLTNYKVQATINNIAFGAKELTLKVQATDSFKAEDLAMQILFDNGVSESFVKAMIVTEF